MRKRIHIENPLQGEKRSLGFIAADRYVRLGHAVWAGPKSIRFLHQKDTPRTVAATLVARKFHLLTCDTGMSTLDNIRRIPVIHPEILIRGTPVALEERLLAR